MTLPTTPHYVRIRRGGNAAAVVFVHGLFGHHSHTWGDFPFLLSQDSRLAHCDFICWGYPSDLRIKRFTRLPFLGHRLPKVPDVANALFTDLCNEQIAGSYGDLVLVGHSLGGLVLLHMILTLLSSADPDKRVLSRLRHLVLYATPTDGVQIPLIARAHPQARSISVESNVIETIRRQWLERVRSVRAEDPEVPGKLFLPVTAIAGLEDAAVPSKSVA
jgi:pimeloyl-ACP methyl ester carboxylesterase